MEPTDNQNSHNSWYNNRELLRVLEPERRRRQAAPEEKHPFSERTALFAKPYKTDKEDELSRRIKNLLGHEDSRGLLSHKSPLNLVWIPEKPRSKSQTCSHSPAPRQTKPHEDTGRGSSLECPDLRRDPEQNGARSNEGHSIQRSEAKAPESKILPEPAKPILHVYVHSIEGMLKEMSSPLPPLLSPLQKSPPRAETSKLPLQAKAKKPSDVPSVEDILREMNSSLPPLLSPLHRSPPRAATSKLPLATQPEPSACKKWHLDNQVTQRKQGAVPREGPREIASGNAREERKKPEQGISSNSCQQHSKTGEPLPKSCGQVAKTCVKMCQQPAKDCQRSPSKMAKTSQQTCLQVAKDFQKSSSQVAKDPQEAYPPTKHSCLKPPVPTREAVAIKRPHELLEHDKSKGVRAVESEPGPLQVTEQSCKEQLEGKERVQPKAPDRKELKLALQEPSEKRKDKGSHQAKAKGFLDPRLLGDAQEGDAFIPSGHRPGDLHKEKVPLPSGEKNLFLPARKLDLKRKGMRSPEESPAKKKREDKGDTPRTKKE